MYLKSIKANGFKSFADKIEIDLQKGITAIVGPNGSGKSNIVDAIRWVLGEQSIKSLRGNGNMTDVIFSGSATRSAQSRAIVSLTFDNSDHYLNSEFSEIEIKRVVYRTGENDYYINNTKVRLKDITELFLDSGAGKESFNIISQGAVGDIINSKPEERRIIFEEAAGVLKYKKRKEDSLKKLTRTKENISKVDLVLNELSATLGPLKEQNDRAKEYLNYQKELQDTEIALIVNDITELNNEYQGLQVNIEALKNKAESLANDNASELSKVEKLKLTSLKVEENINTLNEELINLTDDISSLESQKSVIYERKKYHSEDSVLTQNVLALKEQSLKCANQIQSLIMAITEQKEELVSLNNTQKDNQIDIDRVSASLENVYHQIQECNKNIQITQNTIAITQANIDNQERLPYAVKNILQNPRLQGIHNTIGNLIDIPDQYLTAIEITLGNSINTLVVDNPEAAKSAINYLKENNLGRATFFPLNVIKAKSVDSTTKELLKEFSGFIGFASDLVKYDICYQNIIQNQLGNIIVVTDIDALNQLGKKINYSYRIVTLDGEIQYTGGAISGGTNKNNNSLFKDKQMLTEAQTKLIKLNAELEGLNQQASNYQTKLQNYQQQKENNTIKIVTTNEQIRQKEDELDELKKHQTNLTNDINTNENQLNDTIDDALNELLAELYQKNAIKDQKQQQLKNLKNQKNDLFNEITELENAIRTHNSLVNKNQQELKDKEIKLSRMEVKLDNLLLTLNETYSMTYEKAAATNSLDIDFATARLKVSDLKAKIAKLGVVNLGAPAEYERINTRYEFLSSQKNELTQSTTELLGLISEMDEIMIERFKQTFTKIQAEFSQVFKQLFKGGQGILKLTNPDDYLTTGIDIIAEPPGKKLNSIALLSGGEKTLTAIAVLFAILNIKTVPFCVLDEVEAALDEANVATFGKYLEQKKDNSQFILITHKKKSMEYADVLYGITMQESGVSKLVSVKLEQ